ncbi:hypothetical protein Ciccas_014181 [Cichlidogyrus casuarinus]|uniref:Uncharacterized protein n=1 Tax=Cichlidogyrus casuarinus TaxID=1844966 RepID=A0ABD2PJC0_9PLAT
MPLQSDQCEVLGRQCIKFRSCACPKRDKENIGRKLNVGGSDLSSYQSSGRSSPYAEATGTGPPPKRKRVTKSTESQEMMNKSVEWFEAPQSHIGDDSYTLVAVPNKIPGAVASLQQMRTALLTTFFLAQQQLAESLVPGHEADLSEAKTLGRMKSLLSELNAAEKLASTLYQ